ncbi:MAG TPA: cobalamin biosynthesis protein CbiX [Desulfitobacterium dehalogenans]|uniref:Cobalamin biosynthesis protein CbiX n=1 Tax=Desulfitobacterium dehalogenans TaxID=36854 RepID=A0A7C7D6J9_9FIRM|nr:cobalamin biosynthesis protein CbiX [Desulfitobacterium dehalogenans]
MDTEFILLGHGSRRKEANQGLVEVAHKVSKILGEEVTPVFMDHQEPSLPEGVLEKIQQGAKKIIIMPLFLFRGMHVTVDIHEEIHELKEKYADVEILFTKELGADDVIAQLASQRIKEALGA